MGFVYPLNQLRDRVADVREAVHFAAQRKLQPFVGQNMELFQHAVHASFVNGIEPVGRGRHRCKTDFVKTEVVFQMTINPQNIGYARWSELREP